jgi:hypothetical protein
MNSLFGKDLTANIDEIILNFDESLCWILRLLFELCGFNKTKEFVTVALTGDGGDGFWWI